MRHKRFVWGCPLCDRSGLQPDAQAVYLVRICDGCQGAGKATLTVMQRLELDGSGKQVAGEG